MRMSQRREKSEERAPLRGRKIQQARERWRVTQALRHARARTQMLADSALDAMITINTWGTITEWNTRAEVLFGWTAREAVGRTLTETIVPPAYRAAHDAGMARFLTTGEGPNLNRRLELSALRRDGSEFPIELTAAAQRIGYTYFFSATVRDISERKANEAALRGALEQMEERVAERSQELQRSNDALKAEIAKRARSEEELRRSNERLHSVVTNAPLILFALDNEGVFTLSEGRGLTTLGLEPGQVVGQSVYELYENYPNVLRDIQRALAGETLSAFANLGELVYETRYAPHRDEQENITGIFGVSMDVTENAKAADALRRAKEAAEAANRAKSQFLANVSHELRTPLNAIIGFSEILCDETFGELNEKQARYARNVLSSGRHLLQLINTILDLSKIEAGEMELDSGAFQPEDVLREICQVAAALAAEKQITLTLLPMNNLPILQADHDKFKQALYHIVNNAVKFTPDGGRVTVGATIRTSRVDGRFLEISVTDTGIGIRLEDQERIFTAFEQADASFTRRKPGAGLGLALTRRIVELHGGTLSVQSEDDGRGSVFRFTLPIDRPRSAATEKNAL